MSRDPKTGADAVIDFIHTKVHAGKLFNVTYYNTIGSGNNQDIMIVSGATDAHIVVGVNCSGAGVVKLYEGITSTANGNTIPAYNMYRNSTNTCATAFFSGPTWSTNSEKLLSAIYLPGGASPTTRIGASTRAETEIVFAPSTKYLLRFENQAGATNTATFNIQFYELEV